MELKQLVNNFALLKLKVVSRMCQPLKISGFAGDMLHNNLGAVLKLVDVELANAIYDTNGQVKQFVIVPMQPLQREYQQGELFEFELTLFNQCCVHLPAILNALEEWQSQGFKPDKRHQRGAIFKLQSVDSLAPLMPPVRLYGCNKWYKLPQPFLLADALDGIFQNLSNAWDQEQPSLGASITLTTPIRLTFDNAPQRTAPIAEIWFKAISRRLWFLAKAANLVIDDVNSRDMYYQNLPQNHDVILTNNHTDFVDLKRYDAKQKVGQNLGGLLGGFDYENLDIHHLALLEVGQYLNVGNKTTFGFGGFNWCLIVS
jgi:hypothetical protein